MTQEEEIRYNELCCMAFDFARGNEREELEAMIRAGLSANLINHKGDSLLMLAAYNGNFETVKMLIEMGSDVDLKNDRGQTPLAGAAFKGDLQMVRLLVEEGRADVDADNGMNMSAYSFAVMFGRADVAKYLYEKGQKRGFLKRASFMILKIFDRIFANKKVPNLSV